MTSALEERLGAALTARAEQVQERDLRPEPAPEALLAPVVPLRRRRATYLLASAAAAAVIAVPFVLGGPGDEATPDLPTVEPTAEITPPPDIGADWPVIPSYTKPADLDGDGTPEPVRVRVDGDRFTADRLRLEADLSSTGASVFGVVDLGGNVGYNIVDTIDADSDGGDELVLYVASPDADPLGDVVDLRVLDLVDDFLVEVERRGEPPIRSGVILPDATADGPQQGFAASYKIQNDTLYSAYAVNSYPFGNMTFSAPEVYEAEVWAYRIDNGFLVPQPQERVCVNRLETNRRGEEAWSACGTDSGADVPGIFPAATSVLPFIETVGLEGLPDVTVLLRGDYVEGSPEESDLRLRVETGFGGTFRYAVPDGGRPGIYTTAPSPGPGGDFALLLEQETPDGQQMRFLTVSPGGELVEARPLGDIPLGEGLRADDGTPYTTWLSEDGALHTAVGAQEGDAPRTVYAWDVVPDPGGGDAPRLQSVELGTFCIDEDAPGNTGVTRC